MSKSSQSGWYMKLEHNKFGITEVCYAKTAELAKEFFGYPAVDIEVTRLTWLDMSKLTGCSLASVDDISDYAENDLVFYKEGKTAILWIAK